MSSIVLQILTILLSGAAVASLVLVLSERVVDGNALRKRLTQLIPQNQASGDTSATRTPGNQKVDTVINILSRLSIPEEGWQNSGVRVRFLQAGIRNNNAPRYYYAVKTMLTLVLPALLASFLHFSHPQIPFMQRVMLVLLTAAAGYYLPELALRTITRQRIERMRNGLPDMIDLMVVCTESGMSINAAITRISREMARTNADLAQEFYLSALEMRAGATRIEALRNLALRTTLEDLKDLVSVLAQAEKFGTGLAEALRIQSDMMRTRRSQRAEELAAKIPVKMTIPLVLFIFPTLLLVLLGPAVLQIMNAFSK